MPQPCSATINLTALKHNLQAAKQCAPNSKVMAVLKANAYGHGLVSTAHALAAADGIALARLHEALTLREAGITSRLLLMGNYLNEEHFDICNKHSIDIVVHSLPMAKAIAQLPNSYQLTLWLKLDTGMHRLGIMPEEWHETYKLLSEAPAVKDIVLMSHLSNAENTEAQTTEAQQQIFEQQTDGLKHEKSLANSAATLLQNNSHYDWIRPGIMLYGATDFNSPITLQTVMTLKATIIALRTIPTGEGVGYNQTWKAQRESTIATLAIGYGDGYPRHAKPGTPILINGQRAPLVGNVSMDLISVDVTDIQGDITLDSEAIIWGEDLPVHEIAQYCDTISYTLLTGITARVPRYFIEV